MPESLTILSSKKRVENYIRTSYPKERATIVHCILKKALWIQMWPETFLIQENGIQKKLLHLFNIDFYPKWKSAPAGYSFTLVFEALDKECIQFDLLENAKEKGGFVVRSIQRNPIDVYHIEIGPENLQE